ncbi:GIY-YIG nuclease family protein [Paenarthrobacter sp. A20]|uniref:GIY-YIG nuclease family protein n=1 Tax=Paenarthrobacter sp. A20 TaxID=2817891 RepID=UPI0020A05C9F|nr:GIY-YIG nuclease family protein [Paenarthrobacter sp. A20]MCP1415430.1 hypothetical protein [Paenarthrobacter sp. A20]
MKPSGPEGLSGQEPGTSGLFAVRMSGRTPPRKHFGETLRTSRYGHRLIRDEYALVNKRRSTRLPRELYTDAAWEDEAWAFEDEDHIFFSDEYCAMQRKAALENFDLNMDFFKQLSGKAFMDVVSRTSSANKNLGVVTNLSDFSGVEGIYVMVLDRYKQIYVGYTGDIRARIKRHWSGTKQFDRLIFGNKDSSVLSIDSFRALDTTRIFAAKTTRGFEQEGRLVSALPPDFLLNRVPGGERIMGARFFPWEIKQRLLKPVRPEEPHPEDVAE